MINMTLYCRFFLHIQIKYSELQAMETKVEFIRCRYTTPSLHIHWIEENVISFSMHIGKKKILSKIYARFSYALRAGFGVCDFLWTQKHPNISKYFPW